MFKTDDFSTTVSKTLNRINIKRFRQKLDPKSSKLKILQTHFPITLVPELTKLARNPPRVTKHIFLLLHDNLFCFFKFPQRLAFKKGKNVKMARGEAFYVTLTRTAIYFHLDNLIFLAFLAGFHLF